MPPSSLPSSYRNPTAALNSALASINSTADQNRPHSKATTILNAFEDVASILLRALKVVEGIHPLVGVAVKAFEAAYELNETRRDNDKKVDLIFSKMASMMGVLADMQHIARPETGEDRYDRFCDKLKTVARDIKECTAACDTYSKLTFLKKTFGVKSWDEKFTEFFDLFDQRRVELHLDLSVFIGLDVRNVARAMRMQRERTDLAELFKQLEDPKLREMTRFVNANGGATAFLDQTPDADRRFRDLLARFEGAGADSTILPNAGKNVSADALKSEIRDSADVVRLLKEDRQSFNRKFEAVKLKLDKMNAEIITAIRAGAHDKLSNKDLRHVWREMGWKGSVKARHLVAALSNFYQQKHARQISEAIDSDLSGWITVQEANAFTASMPASLTMTEWMAYWAAGYRVFCINYARAIEGMRATMGGLALHVLPSNQEAVDSYLSDYPLHVADLLVRGIIVCANESEEAIPMNLTHRFVNQWQSDQADVRTQLNLLHWEIDAENSLSIVTGGGQIEKFIFPLLYVLLQRHIQLLKLAAMYKLSNEELGDARRTISVLMTSVAARVRTLASIFRGQNLDPATEFRYAHGGMFSVVYPGLQWGVMPDRFKYDEQQIQEADYVPEPTVLNHPHQPPPTGATRKILHVCNAFPVGPRYRCLDCEGFSIIYSIDLCIECAQHDVKRAKDNLNHKQSHDLLRTMRVIYPRDLWRVMSDALNVLKRARQAFIVPSRRTRADGDNRGENRRLPACTICRTPLQLPFWICIECNHNKYTLCRACERLTCDADFKYPDRDSHSWHHVLVKVQKPATDANVDDRFAVVDDRLTIVEGRLATVEQKLDRIIDILTRPRHK
ncbi:hypothetical protein EXIGLDRAFT_835699 [Exidia glandulosa HHB12029]|uniref:ZZ-type domain-containing protein n=1 Tax=Exidia glandulosa HHB12029 TaxID=1314781 RepID=A0A165IK61_EXIGL|nr:hypothetical protein EXIGLDRAFT_835699 [Exidia glandulosa HHB12029]